jgi:acyl CoA:acetate/3-ketoacid CoA transferase beta subunit
MEHTARDGAPKVVERCALPLTGKACVDTIVTDLAVFSVRRGEGLTLVELSPFAESIEQVRAATGCAFDLAPALRAA